MAKPNVAEKTVNTVLELTGKFTLGFLKAVTGRGTATKEKNLSFNGKAKVAKGSGDTASKIKPLKQGNELIDMLMKIYTFMNKSFEEDKLHREKLENFKEEAKIEADKRHKALLAAIKDLMKDKKDDKTADKVEANAGMSIGDIINSIINAFGTIEMLTTVGAFLINPVTLTLLGTLIAAGGVTAWIASLIKQDPQAALRGEGPAGAAVVGPGGAQYKSYDEEQANKDLEEKAKAVDKKGLKVATLDELEAKLQQQIQFGNAKSPEVAELKKEIESRKSEQTTPVTTATADTTTPTATPVSTPVPATSSTPAPTPAATPTQASTASSLSPGESVVPAPSTPASAKLNAVQSENNSVKVSALTEPSSSTINNVSTAKVSNQYATKPKSKIPPVRNLEESFQKMITYSTRVV